MPITSMRRFEVPAESNRHRLKRKLRKLLSDARGYRSRAVSHRQIVS